MSRARNWCFTCFADPERQFADYPAFISYCIWQLEEAPESKLLHKQGYVECNTTVSLNQLKKWLPMAHWEIRKGSQSDAINYCKKEDTRVEGPHEYGKPKEQGKRNDIGDAMESIKKGSDLKAMIEEHPAVYFKYSRAVEKAQRIFHPPKMRPKPQIRFFYGRPGSGKSFNAHNLAPDAYSASDLKECWFDGYNGEDTIIFDDFEGNFNLRLMLKLLDWYPLQLPVKGGFVTIKAYKFIFTSNYEPQMVYQGNDAWLRRITDFGESVYFDGVFDAGTLAPYFTAFGDPNYGSHAVTQVEVPVLPSTSVQASSVPEPLRLLPATPVVDYDAEFDNVSG